MSLPADLVRRIDKRRGGRRPRSREFEAWLEEAERSRRQHELDEEIIAYYSVPPTAEEIALSKALGRAAKRALARSERSGW